MVFSEKTSHDIAGSIIMNKKAIAKLKAELTQMRQNFAPVPSRKLARYAQAVGRELDRRGKEPNWVRKRDPALSPPLSIPRHSQEVKAGTARSIIDALLDDLDDWLLYLQEVEDDAM